MASHSARDLDGFLPLLQKSDTRIRQQVGTDLLAFLAEPSNPIVCQDIGQFIDGLIPWMQSSNYKVSSNGIEAMTYLIDRLGMDFRPYLQTVLPNVIDRLGDAKDTVREKSQLLILKLLERNVLTPQILLDKLSPAFNHKNAKIREEILRCLVNTLNEHGSQSLTISRVVPDIVKLLSDPTATVRDTAFNTLVDIYKHIGEKLRIDLQRRNLVPQSKWPTLSARFDEVRDSGELLNSAKCSDADVVDRIVMAKPAIAIKKPNLGSAVKRTFYTSSSTASAGAVDEDTFIKQFEDVPTIQIFYPKEVTEHLKNIQDIISDPSKDWNKRADALKKIRSLVIAGGVNYEEFYIGLKQLEIPLQTTIKDLRSQVVREACITISYLAKTLGNKFDKTAEMLLQPLINLIQNSAKVMSTAGAVTVRFIILNTHSSRFIPIITTNATQSKSKDIRRSCCEFLDLMLSHWPTYPLEKHVAALQEAVKKGIADADPDARVISRRAFRGFREHFPDQSEALVQSLDPSYRRALLDGMSASSSNNNLASGFKTPRQFTRPAPHSATDSGRKGFRSNSAIDLQAAQRAKARAQYAAFSRNKITSGTASLPRPRKASDAVATSTERISRTRNRNSQSQPTSRSGSPSSRLAYLYNRSTEHDSPRPRRLSSGIPRSTAGSRETSRETSPNRSLGRLRQRSNDRPPLSPASRPVLAQKILQQSREAENALADAFNDSSTETYRMSRKAMRSLENHSDESETSSVCSERSYDSFKKHSDSYSWSGSQQRLARDMWEPCRDIIDIIGLCASTNWQERKDGLLSLQHYLATEMRLTPGQLSHLIEIFTKMFMDSHTKGLSVFLDTLHEVIRIHKNDLHDWIYVLLQRVFLKIGTETLNSVQNKLLTTLDIIRNNFPTTLLMTNVYRFLKDTTQTPNTRVKTVVLNFLTSLCNNSNSFIADVNALEKIINFAQDPKSADIRNAAKLCFMSMWNCNTPQVTMMFSELTKEQQDIATNIVQSHMRKSSTGSEPGSPMITGSPSTPPLKHGLDQEEIYRSLRKTTAEIQNYSYEALGSKLDRDRDTTSQDSGISQMSVGNDVKNDIATLEERMDDLTIKQTLLPKSGNRSLPYQLENAANGVKETENDKNYKSLEEVPHSDIIRRVLEHCILMDETTSNAEKKLLFAQMLDLIKHGHVELLVQNKNFKRLLRIIVDHLDQSNLETHEIVLELLTAIFSNNELKDDCMHFTELLTLRVAPSFCDSRRQVVKTAEQTAAAMVIFPLDKMINALAPSIQTGLHPIQGSLKMLTILFEVHPDPISEQHLSQLMPSLIKSADHEDSLVRKSSVFCMVAIYKKIGEEQFTPWIKSLPTSKLKLLSIYIRRTQKNSPNPSLTS